MNRGAGVGSSKQDSVSTDRPTSLPGSSGLFSSGLFLGLIFWNLSFACPTYHIPQSELKAFFSLIQIFFFFSLPPSLCLPVAPSLTHSITLSSSLLSHLFTLVASLYPSSLSAVFHSSSSTLPAFYPCSLSWSFFLFYLVCVVSHH